MERQKLIFKYLFKAEVADSAHHQFWYLPFSLYQPTLLLTALPTYYPFFRNRLNRLKKADSLRCSAPWAQLTGLAQGVLSVQLTDSTIYGLVSPGRVHPTKCSFHGPFTSMYLVLECCFSPSQGCSQVKQATICRLHVFLGALSVSALIQLREIEI